MHAAGAPSGCNLPVVPSRKVTTVSSVSPASVSYVVEAGRCLLAQPAPCNPANDLCGGGASCAADHCSPGSCDVNNQVCVNDPGTACSVDSDCNRCAPYGGSCGRTNKPGRAQNHPPKILISFAT